MSTPISTPTPIPAVIPGAKPTSIKIQPWTDFPRQSYSIHNDDFCHSKPLVAKFNAKGSRSTLNIKETISRAKDGKFNVEDDVKLWFDLPNSHSLYTRVKSTNYIKIHYDHGLLSCGSRFWNYYGSFWTNKSLSNSSIRVGAAVYDKNCQLDNRLRVDTSSGKHQFYLYNRSLSIHNNFKWSIISVVDLTNQVLQKNNVLLGYTINDKNSAFLRLENSGYRNANPQWNNVQSLWDNIIGNYVFQFDSTTRFGIEGSWNLRNNQFDKAEIVTQKILRERGITVKAKLNTKYDVALVFKRALWGIQDLATFSFGLGINNAISDRRNIQQGVQVDFNI